MKEPQVQIAMKLSEKYQSRRITLTRLRFDTESIAQAAFIVHNFEPMITALSVKIQGFPNIETLDKFHEFLSQLTTWNNANEFDYIPKVKQYINSRIKQQQQ